MRGNNQQNIESSWVEDSREVTNEEIGMIIAERSPHLNCFTSTSLSTKQGIKKNSKRTQNSSKARTWAWELKVKVQGCSRLFKLQDAP
jgi:methyltransferase-like protein